MAQELCVVSPRHRFPMTLLFPEIVMDHVSTLKLHQLRYNELPANEAQQLQAHIGDCDRCRGRLQALDNQRAAFEMEAVPDAIRALAAKQRQPSVWDRLQSAFRSPVLLGGLAVAAAAAVTVNIDFGNRSKGGESVEIIVEGIDDWEPGDLIRAGDRIQIRVPGDDLEQVWLGDGEELLAEFPMTPSNKWELVPISLLVDDVGEAEHIVVVLSNHPLTREEAEDAVDGRDIGGVEVQELVLPKER